MKREGLAVITLAALLAAGEGPGAESGKRAGRPSTAAEVSTLYLKNCASCHGKDGKGNPGMAKIFKVDLVALDLTDQETRGKKDEVLSTAVLKGKGKMPSYAGKIPEGDVRGILAYLRGLGPPAKAEAKKAEKE